jgi:acyl-CoA thioesterase YciA
VEAERNSDIVTLTEADVTYVAVEMTDGERRPVPLGDG